MAIPETEKAFSLAMTQVYQRAKKEAGYTATRFAQMLGEHGGIKTAKLLLRSNTVSEGFTALWEAGRLDLTVEYHALLPQYASLFSDEELDTARQRLTEYGMREDSIPGSPTAKRGGQRGNVDVATKRPTQVLKTEVTDRVESTERETPESVLLEISRRRNAIENRLRQVLSEGLRYSYGQKAAAALVGCLSESRRVSLVGKSYADMWQALYFNELHDVISKEWSAFAGWFGQEKDKVLGWLEHVNRSRVDAHARHISDEDLAYLRICFRRLEEALDIDVT